MALNIGKKMVYLLALSSFTLATWGISLFSTPVLTPVIGADGKPKDGSWQEIDQRKAKIDLWFKDAKDGSPSPIQIAANRYHASRDKMQKIESQIADSEKYYLEQLEFLKRIKKVNPILLLDDIFDKLDENRVKHLLELVNTNQFGQIFITDTHPERIEQLLKAVQGSHKMFEIEKGSVKKVWHEEK